MKIIIDRFENDIAVVELENGKMIDCPRELFPNNAKEGSIIKIMVDEKATTEKLEQMQKRLNRLFKD